MMPALCLWWMQATGIPLAPCAMPWYYKTAFRPAGPWWWPEAPEHAVTAVRGPHAGRLARGAGTLPLTGGVARGRPGGPVTGTVAVRLTAPPVGRAPGSGRSATDRALARRIARLRALAMPWPLAAIGEDFAPGTAIGGEEIIESETDIPGGIG